MYFTQEDYKKIENWLHRNSVKDTEFQEALPFTGKEIVTVVQDGHNRKVNIQEFINQLYKHGVEDFLNVTNTYRANNITLKEAIRLIPAEARKEGQVITFLNTEGNWEIYQFTGKLNQWNNTTLWNNPFDWEKFVVDSILPDEEDLTKSAPDAKGNAYLSLKNRKYEPDKYSGLGRKILRRRVVEIEDPIYGTQEKNLLLQADFAEDNTVYVVRYDFTLNGQDITLPDNSYIEYEGGSISDGNIIDRAGGLSRVVLKKNIINGKNILTQDMVSTPNTIYEIRYDFTLSENVTIPANCVLKFNGGSISGGHTITGNNTGIEAGLVKIFSNIVVSGSWNVNKIYSDWCDKDTIGLRNLVNLSSDNIYNIIYLKGGNYIGVVDTIKYSLIELKSNTTLVINATIELQTNRLERYSIISVGGKKNVSIIGSGIIIGDADTHTTEGEGFCNGITIWESENVKIEGLTIQKCFTDCIYVGGGSIPSKNIRINDCQFKESRRQGVSICNCVIFDVSNCFISDILGTEPERCIDIEPNANGVCKSGIISNNRFNSNRGLVCNGSAGVIDGIFIKNNIFNTAEYSLNNVLSNNIYIDKNIIYSGNIVISSGTNINVLNNTISAQTIKFDAICSIENNKITVSQLNCYSNNTRLKDNDIHGNISFGSSNITISGNIICNNIIHGDLFVNSNDGEIYNNIFYGKNNISKANSIHNNQFIYFTRRENDSCLATVNVKYIADNLFNAFSNTESQDAQSLYTFISITAPTFATVLSGNTFINQNAQLSQYFCVIDLSSNTNKIFAYDNICSEENKTYGDSSKIFGTIVRYKNRGAVSELPSLPNTALGNIYWDKDNNKPLFKTNAGWVDATGATV